MRKLGGADVGAPGTTAIAFAVVVRRRRVIHVRLTHQSVDLHLAAELTFIRTATVLQRRQVEDSQVRFVRPIQWTKKHRRQIPSRLVISPQRRVRPPTQHRVLFHRQPSSAAPSGLSFAPVESPRLGAASILNATEHQDIWDFSARVLATQSVRQHQSV